MKERTRTRTDLNIVAKSRGSEEAIAHVNRRVVEEDAIPKLHRFALHARIAKVAALELAIASWQPWPEKSRRYRMRRGNKMKWMKKWTIKQKKEKSGRTF
jgi:hypothetical protein